MTLIPWLSLTPTPIVGTVPPILLARVARLLDSGGCPREPEKSDLAVVSVQVLCNKTVGTLVPDGKDR